MNKNIMVTVYYVAAALFLVDAIMVFSQGGKTGNGIVWLFLCVVMIYLGYSTARKDMKATGIDKKIDLDAKMAELAASKVEMKFDDSDEDIFADMRTEAKEKIVTQASDTNE